MCASLKTLRFWCKSRINYSAWLSRVSLFDRKNKMVLLKTCYTPTVAFDGSSKPKSFLLVNAFAEIIRVGIGKRRDLLKRNRFLIDCSFCFKWAPVLTWLIWFRYNFNSFLTIFQNPVTHIPASWNSCLERQVFYHQGCLWTRY